MDVTISIKDRYLKDRIRETLQYAIYMEYDAPLVVQAGVPPLATMVDELFNDQAFMDSYHKYIKDHLMDGCPWDTAVELDADVKFVAKVLKPWFTKLDKLAKQHRVDTELKEAMELLQDRGYKVTR